MKGLKVRRGNRKKKGSHPEKEPSFYLGVAKEWPDAEATRKLLSPLRSRGGGRNQKALGLRGSEPKAMVHSIWGGLWEVSIGKRAVKNDTLENL